MYYYIEKNIIEIKKCKKVEWKKCISHSTYSILKLLLILKLEKRVILVEIKKYHHPLFGFWNLTDNDKKEQCALLGSKFNV